jgi:hypothetical protein
MKTGIFLVLGWLCITTTYAQQITDKHISFSGKETVKLNIQIADSIVLHTWNKDEVYVHFSVNINDNKDNEAYVTTYDESGSQVIIKSRFADNYFKDKKNCCNCSAIFWDVYIPENTDFSIESINANITITGKTEQMNVKSISGYIDLTTPADKNAELIFSTISGTIYTNHEIVIHEKKRSIPCVIKENLNNGGSQIKLETISGDIFFRKPFRS